MKHNITPQKSKRIFCLNFNARHLRRIALPAHHADADGSMTPIPDNVEGAFLISVIDFILSFVIISGIGVILAILPVVNRYWVIDDKDLKGGH